MESFSKLVTAIAALAGAVAWPVLFGGIVFAFRKEVRSALAKVPTLFERIRKASLAGINLESSTKLRLKQRARQMRAGI
jgi:hypothetical protein